MNPQFSFLEEEPNKFTFFKQKVIFHLSKQTQVKFCKLLQSHLNSTLLWETSKCALVSYKTICKSVQLAPRSTKCHWEFSSTQETHQNSLWLQQSVVCWLAAEQHFQLGFQWLKTCNQIKSRAEPEWLSRSLKIHFYLWSGFIEPSGFGFSSCLQWSLQ